MAVVIIDRNRISNHFKANVTVTADEPFTAIEARATGINSAFGRGIGQDLLNDDSSTTNGVLTLTSPQTAYSFDVECSELLTDGQYRVSVFVMNENGVWNDTAALFTAENYSVKDSSAAVIRVKRDGSGTDESYTSAYSGEVINNFIAEVLYE